MSLPVLDYPLYAIDINKHIGFCVQILDCSDIVSLNEKSIAATVDDILHFAPMEMHRIDLTIFKYHHFLCKSLPIIVCQFRGLPCGG